MAKQKTPTLETVNTGAAAVDIGSREHMAAVNPDVTDMPVRAFGTFTHDLHDLATWFKSQGVTSVAMESTGVYWIPAYEVLEQHGFEVILVNARYAKNVPGRKTDVIDASWLRQLHSYGLLRGSFRPTAKIATLRAYLRQRERLVEYAAAYIQHMQKALMEMNLQLHHVVSDITGVTGMRIIRAIVAGERDLDVLASYRDVRCHASVETIKAACNWIALFSVRRRRLPILLKGPSAPACPVFCAASQRTLRLDDRRSRGLFQRFPCWRRPLFHRGSDRPQSSHG